MFTFVPKTPSLTGELVIKLLRDLCADNRGTHVHKKRQQEQTNNKNKVDK